MEGFHRASGDCICEDCGEVYYDHQYDMEELGYDGQPFLIVLCNGERVKL
jgi:hypothetical protein